MCARPWMAAALAAVMTACAENATAPVPAVPDRVILIDGGGQAATIGTALPAAVTFQVLRADGQPFAGAAVTFSASHGGMPAPASGTTSAGGLVTTTWTLGGTVAIQSLEAEVNDSVRVSVTANATAVAVASATIVAGSGQSAPAGTALGGPVTVEVRGTNGAVFPGATVTFSANNGGSANPASGTTSASGRLTTTWTLGSATGTQMLTATVASVNASVTATATTNGCISSIAITFAVAQADALQAGDCTTLPTGNGGTGYTDRYQFQAVGGSIGARLDLTAAFDMTVRVKDASTGTLVGVSHGTSGANRIELLAGSGSYIAEVTSIGSNVTGPYQLLGLRLTSASATASCDPDPWVVKGASATGRTFAATDCTTTMVAGPLTPGFTRYYDRYQLRLAPGQSATVTMGSTTGFDSFLIVQNTGTGATQYDDDSGGGALGWDARVVITAPAGTPAAGVTYWIYAISRIAVGNPGSLGTYFLNVN